MTQIVPGGGAIEMELSKYLSEHSLQYTSKVGRQAGLGRKL